MPWKHESIGECVTTRVSTVFLSSPKPPRVFLGLSIKQDDVCFCCVCSVIDHEFRHNIVKVTVDAQTTLTMLGQNSSSITGQTCEKLRSICFYGNKLPICPLLLIGASQKL